VSDGFTDRVVAATKTVPAKKEVFGKISYRFGFASAAFMVAAAVVFFILGPSTSINQPALTDTEQEIKSALELPEDPETLDDIGENSSVEVWSVPEDILARDKMLDDSLLMADTSSKIDQFILPEVDKGLKVNKKF
jgi:hypothetical protein